ncbi:hypothetical protein C8J57DRAFT_1566701, partial [Mycena rebaudengoi]
MLLGILPSPSAANSTSTPTSSLSVPAAALPSTFRHPHMTRTPGASSHEKLSFSFRFYRCHPTLLASYFLSLFFGFILPSIIHSLFHAMNLCFFAVPILVPLFIPSVHPPAHRASSICRPSPYPHPFIFAFISQCPFYPTPLPSYSYYLPPGRFLPPLMRAHRSGGRISSYRTIGSRPRSMQRFSFQNNPTIGPFRLVDQGVEHKPPVYVGTIPMNADTKLVPGGHPLVLKTPGSSTTSSLWRYLSFARANAFISRPS